MSIREILALTMTGIAIALFVSERVRPDLVALIMLVAFPLLGLTTPEAALGSLGSPIVVTLIAVFILGQALTTTGVSQSIAVGIQYFARGREGHLRTGLIAAGAFLSLFMNNMAAAAVLMPAAMEVARRQRTPPSQLLLPLAFATKLAGMATLFTTSNLIAGEYLLKAGYAPFKVLDFLPVGGTVALIGMLYLALLAWRWLPRQSARDTLLQDSPEMLDLPRLYDLEERIWELVIPSHSPLAGKTLAQSEIGKRWGLSVLNVCNGPIECPSPGPDVRLEPGSRLTVIGREDRIHALQQTEKIRYNPAHPAIDRLLSEQIGMVEVVIPPRSRAAGRSLREMGFREKYSLTAVALWREGRSYRTGVGEIMLDFGDALLLYGPYEAFDLLKRDPDFLTLTGGRGEIRRPQRAPIALFGFISALILAAAGVLPTGLAMLLGATLSLAGGCLTMNEAYEAVDWRSIFIIAGMLPLGTAMAETGAAGRLAGEVVALTAPAGPLGLLAGFLALTLILIQVIPGGAAVPTLLVPIAIPAAARMGLDPRQVAMGIAIVTGASFITPFSHPANLLVMGPGGYTTRDYVRIGAPLALLTAGLTMLLLSL